MKNNIWSNHDNEIMKIFYPTEGYKGVSKRLEVSRGRQAIVSRAFRMGLVSNAPRYSHGMVGTRTYKAWYSCIQRCTNTNHPESERYLKKGIKVCDRWLESFQYFVDDMGAAPSDKHVIDRIDPEDGYNPGNCRWATQRQSAENTSIKSHSQNPYKGISKLPSGKYRALCNRSLLPRHIGVFDSAIEAAMAYDAAALDEFGEFAMTNKRLGLL